MTANQIKGKGFRGALRYNLDKISKNMAEVLDHSFLCVDERTILKEVQMVRILKPNLQKFFYHTSINFPPHENVSNDLMRRIAHDYLLSNGFTQHQFIFFRHYDASHPHLHILVNRIGYDGKVLSDSNDFARSENVLRELEKKYNLTQVVSSKQASIRAPTKNELEMAKRTNTPSLKTQLQTIITNVLDKRETLTCSQFIKALQDHGVRPKFNIATTGYVSGISYDFQGLLITGSKLGSAFKWTTLRNKIDYDQGRDKAVIEKANGSTDRHVTQTGSIKAKQVLNNHFQEYKDFGFQNQAKDNLIESIVRVENQFEINPENALELKKKKRRRKGLQR